MQNLFENKRLQSSYLTCVKCGFNSVFHSMKKKYSTQKQLYYVCGCFASANGKSNRALFLLNDC